jgi:RNA polymerase sigma-70 factor (ECF subfamily)
MTSPPPDPQPLLERLRRGDRDALAPLLVQHHGRLCSVAARLVGDASAEDIVQQAWITWLADLQEGRLAEGTALRRLYHHTADLAWNEQRRQRRRRALLQWLPMSPGQAAMPGSGGLDARLELDGWLGGLSATDRLCLVLQHGEGWTAVEIGTLLGMQADAVTQRVSRARRRLRQQAAAPPPTRTTGGMLPREEES